MISKKSSFTKIILHAVLFIYAFIVLYPLFIMVLTSFKTNMEVLKKPFGFPNKLRFAAYETVFGSNNFLTYYKNSILVTIVSLSIIIVVSILASYVLARYVFPGSRFVYFYFLAGMMIPIRLGVINLFKIFQAMHLFDNLLSLILIYSAMGIPFSVFIITGFFRQIPKSLEEAAYIDGSNRMQTIRKIFVPLLKPAISTAAIYHFVPIWNDFYFPLIFIRSDHLKTVPLGTAIFFGQFQTDWPTVFAALTTAVLPSLIFYLVMSKQFITGLTAGAVKG